MRFSSVGAVAGACLVAATACGEPTRPEQVVTCTPSSMEVGAFARVPAGQFLKGKQPVYPEEQPTITVHVEAFDIQIHEVTNDQFAAFVDATGFETDAERNARLAGREAGSAVFQHPAPDSEKQSGAWSLVLGATWRTPFGPNSDIDGRGNYPVIHISHADASAYADWAGGRLASEIEWEYAAQLGLPDASRPDSGAYDEHRGAAVANTWQGIFPLADTGADGAAGLAPVGCYAPSSIGLYDMIGNAWEWTATPYSDGSHTIKGGSFLCSDNFCRRFRPAARQPQESDFSSNHIGFRVVRDFQTP